MFFFLYVAEIVPQIETLKVITNSLEQSYLHLMDPLLECSGKLKCVSLRWDWDTEIIVYFKNNGETPEIAITFDDTIYESTETLNLDMNVLRNFNDSLLYRYVDVFSIC